MSARASASLFLLEMVVVWLPHIIWRKLGIPSQPPCPVHGFPEEGEEDSTKKPAGGLLGRLLGGGGGGGATGGKSRWKMAAAKINAQSKPAQSFTSMKLWRLVRTPRC